MKVERLLVKAGSLTSGLVLAVLVLFCMGVTIYCHFVLRIEVVFSHLFYVPIVLAGIWWGMYALLVAALLGGWLIFSHWLSGIEASYLMDLFRFALFLLVAGLVGALWREFHKTEEELRGTRDFLGSLVSASQIPTAVWNDCGIVTMFNRALGELTGYTPEQMLGQPVKALFPGQAFIDLRHALESRQVPLELSIRCSDGQEAVCLWSPVVIPGPGGGAPAAWMVQGLDITKRKWAENILARQAEQLRLLNERLSASESRLFELNSAKDKFFSIISHDLRSPFMPLLLYSDMLVKEQANLSPQRMKDFATAIHANARRLYGLVENLLEWSRIQTGRMEHHPDLIDVEDLVQRNIALLQDGADAKRIKLIPEVAAGLRAWGDRYQINCVLQNLISNGVKFTQPGGTVRVTARGLDGTTRISVADNGVGMGEEALRAVFRIDTYHTTQGTGKEKGSGLGLILCRELLEKNASRMEVTSREGEGSTFSFTLPAEKPTSGTPSA
jgi:PAS domain S-box-containing protein